MTIQVTLMGGLANQAFQYAAALSVVGPGNEDQIIADVSWLEAHANVPGITPRSFQLDALGVAPGRDDGRLMESFHESTPWDYEPGKEYHLRGYFQDHKYWAPWIRSWFQDRIPKTEKRPGTLAIHVRRGDYCTNPSATAFHGVMPIEYFTDAVNELTASNPIDQVLVFSDGPDWCEAELLPRIRLPASIVVGQSPWLDIADMASCDHHIISNSTFGWLGAYLADSSRVIYPKNWFTNDKTAPPIFPSTWHRR